MIFATKLSLDVFLLLLFFITTALSLPVSSASPPRFPLSSIRLVVLMFFRSAFGCTKREKHNNFCSSSSSNETRNAKFLVSKKKKKNEKKRN